MKEKCARKTSGFSGNLFSYSFTRITEAKRKQNGSKTEAPKKCGFHLRVSRKIGSERSSGNFFGAPSVSHFGEPCLNQIERKCELYPHNGSKLFFGGFGYFPSDVLLRASSWHFGVSFPNQFRRKVELYPHNGSKTEAERKQNGSVPKKLPKFFGERVSETANFTRITEAKRKQNGSKTEAKEKCPTQSRD